PDRPCRRRGLCGRALHSPPPQPPLSAARGSRFLRGFTSKQLSKVSAPLSLAARGSEMPANPRPRRSALYVPGANTRALDKGRTIATDVLILDLEDAVAPGA